jgi:DNA-binding beta-propeller fold protein YncE
VLAGCLTVVAGLLGCWSLGAQPPQATEIQGEIFSIKKTWVIGGEGNWDYLTLDPSALKLYIAHGSAVQVVDVNAGAVAGEVTGLRDAHQIALDDDGQFGYVSDGTASELKIFDRETLSIVASIPTGKNPRGVVFDPESRLIFVVCPDTAPESRIPRYASNGQRVYDPFVQSTITVIDADSQKRLADLILPGKLGFAQSDGRGTVYVSISDRNQIGYFDAQDFSDRLRRRVSRAAAKSAETKSSAAKPDNAKPDNAKPDSAKPETAAADDPTLTIDWTETAREAPTIPNPVKTFGLGRDCMSPKGLAIDSANMRLFTACDNQKMEVLNSANGQVVAALPVGVGTDAIGYDAARGLIYVSNGGAVNGSNLGSLTIIRQHLSDSYAVIQDLPTQARARTLAVNPDSGEVYLVTNIQGFDLSKNGAVSGTSGSGHTLPAVQTTAVKGSFQVLVVGN